MKLKFKKYLYLINDLTNAALSKDRAEWHEKYRKLFYLALTLGFFLAISLAFNLYYYVKN
jgi:hypothetical protein